MKPVKEMLEVADEYAQQSTWTDFALVKACMCAMGIMIGLSIPKDKQKPVFVGAAIVCTATCIPLMAKLFPILKDHLEKE